MKKTRDIRAHFQRTDPVIFEFIKTMELEILKIPKSNSDYFVRLCGDILGQQLAGKAADAITGRFLKLFPKGVVTPDKVLAITPDMMRGVGMSWAKVKYITDLARQTKIKSVDLSNLHNMDDEEVIKELTKVKGVGPWTAEMFLIFTLGREDVFSNGDLGLRNAIKKLYGKRKPPIEKWSPYKSYACLALWKSLEK